MPLDFLKDAASVLTPPPDGGPTPEYRWRLTVAASIVVGYAVALLQAALIWGVFAAFGFAGFARAEDVNTKFIAVNNDRRDVQQKFDGLSTRVERGNEMIMRTVIAGQILTMAASGCTAKRAGNIGLADSISGQLSSLQSQYMDFSGGRLYPVEPCS